MDQTQTPQEEPTPAPEQPREVHPEELAASSALRGDAIEGFAEEDEAPISPAQEELDDVEKMVKEKTWKVSGTITAMSRGGLVQETFEREYVQKPLSYLGMMQFTGLLGRKLDEVMGGPEGLSSQSLGEIIDLQQLVQRDEEGNVSLGDLNLSIGDFSGIDSFVRGLAKIAAYAPDIMAEAQCIWLRIPLRERLAVMEIWSKPVDEGGLSMDDGEEMLDIFIQQNYKEVEDFLVKRLRRIGKRIARERKKLHPEAPSDD
jgi:hypothetical protein